jgi:hypothetical protein
MRGRMIFNPPAGAEEPSMAVSLIVTFVPLVLIVIVFLLLFRFLKQHNERMKRAEQHMDRMEKMTEEMVALLRLTQR